MMIEYCNRRIYVDFTNTRACYSTGYKGEFILNIVEYKGRNITRLVDRENIELAVANELINHVLQNE